MANRVPTASASAPWAGTYRSFQGKGKANDGNKYPTYNDSVGEYFVAVDREGYSQT